MLLAAEVLPARDPRFDGETEAALLIVFNAEPTPVEFVLPKSEFHWHRVLTTASDETPIDGNQTIAIDERSVQLFELLM